jgi:cation-transporting ATPase 13A1
VQIMQRHHFASHLKRMAVVARTEDNFVALVKGAPETIQERLVQIPAGYIEAYKQFTRQGSRVLALAYKLLPDMAVGEARVLEREVVESELTFAGFAVFACPLRSDSAQVLKELKDSSHYLVSIMPQIRSELDGSTTCTTLEVNLLLQFSLVGSRRFCLLNIVAILF